MGWNQWNRPMRTAPWLAVIAACGLLGGCEKYSVDHAFEPAGPVQAMSAERAHAACEARARSARRAAAGDIWAQGGEPAYHQAYAACMTEMGWRRVVRSSRMNY